MVNSPPGSAARNGTQTGLTALHLLSTSREAWTAIHQVTVASQPLHDIGHSPGLERQEPRRASFGEERHAVTVISHGVDPR